MTNIKSKILFILLYYFTFSNCLLKLPLKGIKIKGVSKNNKVKIKRPISESDKSTRSLATLEYDEGEITFNENYLFLTNLKIGTPAQNFNLLLDTMKNVLWVARSSSNANIRNFYSPSRSSSSEDTEETFSLNYDTGSVRGNLYIDKLNYIYDLNFNMKFLAASSVGISLGGADGIIGLGKNYKDEELSFLHMLKKNNVTESTLFSLLFEDTIEEGATGHLIIGKHENFTGKNSVSFPLVKDVNKTSTNWNFTIDGFSIKKNGSEINYNKSFSIVFDTAHNYIYLPYELLNDTVKNLSAMDCEPYQGEDGEREDINLRCLEVNNTLPDLILKINGNNLKIPANYTFALNYIHHYSNIYFTKSNNFVIGQPFFFAFHTLFDRDNEQIQVCPNDPSYLEKGEDKKDDKGKDGKGKDGGKDDGNGSSLNGGKKGINKWLIVGIIAAVLIFLIILAIIICCCCYNKSGNAKEDEDLEKGVDDTDPILENENK